MNDKKKLVLGIVLAVYVAAIIAAYLRFSADRFPSQLAGWIGGAAFVLIIVLFRDARREKKLREKIERDGLIL